MATTANTSRTTPTVRGNHPAGRALQGGAVARHAAEQAVAPGAPLRLVQARAETASVTPVQERWADVVPLRRPADGLRPADVRPAPVRLTRRGRRAVLGLVVAGGVGLAALVGPAVVGGQPAGGGLALAGESSVVVAPGDTLWSIAGTIAPDSDPRAVVHALRAMNDLDGVDLVPGQVLQVP
ncbi:MAG: Peptidoglycan-binding lysin domain protein [Klenkia sp.]|nr:Peptidoglycan-binding lysin domain protein [Klenkia sp.]